MAMHERHVSELDLAYRNWMASNAACFALYQDDPRTLELKHKVMRMFGIDEKGSDFPSQTPKVTKNVGNEIDCVSQPEWTTQIFEEFDRISAEKLKQIQEQHEKKYMPSFSIGLTPIEPKNILDDILVEASAKCDEETECAEGVVDDIDEERKTAEKVEGAGIGRRQRRDRKLPDSLRSPYVSRVVEISKRTIKFEEEALWQWLFSTQSNEK